MQSFTILAVAVISVTFALDLETMQKNSQRHHDYTLSPKEKRKIQMPPSYSDVYKDYNGDPSASRISDSQQYYRRVQELLANLISQKNRGDLNWLENLRQREINLRQMTDIRPPYDQDDFPAYSQKAQEDSLTWALPLSQVVRPPAPAEKHHAAYRSHKQFPYSTRVPQEEMMKKRSVDSNIGDQAKTVGTALEKEKKDGIKAGVLEQANTTNGNKKMSPDQFKQWLTDEYYRNMAMSFATMRKKRSILEQTGGAVAPPSRDEEEGFEKLRLMEESLLQDALQDIIHGGSEGHATKKKPQFAGKLDVAQDIENLKRVLQSLLADTQKLKVINEAEIMASLRNAAKDVDPAREEQDQPTQCPELRVLTNGCTALRGMFPPEPVQGQFLASCNWHGVCYSCGAQYGISAEQCDKSFLLDMKYLCAQLGSCNPNLTSLLLTPLHKKRVFIKQNILPMCERPCVVNFLART